MQYSRFIPLIFLFFSFSLDNDSVVHWSGPMTHDFGDLEFQKTVKHDFEFKNISGEPFVIDNVRTSCGCTAPDWSEAPILPDSTAKISIEFDARKQGYFRKWIRVYFSNQRKAERLYIEGYVE